MRMVVYQILIGCIFLSKLAYAVEIEDIYPGDIYILKSDDIECCYKIIVVEIDKTKNLVKVKKQDGSYDWVKPNELSTIESSINWAEMVGASNIAEIFAAYEAVDQALENMPDANISFNVPVEMNIDDTQNIRLLLSFVDTIEQLEKQLAKDVGQSYSAQIKVSNQMEARLTGSNFEVIAISPELQAVTKDQKTEWLWEIHPTKVGTHTIHLTLTAFVDVYGHQSPRMVRTFDRTITVSVTAGQKAINFLSKNWQWFWAAALVPLVGWVFSSARKKLTKPSSGQGR